jgi:hypothetical protein
MINVPSACGVNFASLALDIGPSSECVAPISACSSVVGHF